MPNCTICNREFEPNNKNTKKVCSDGCRKESIRSYDKRRYSENKEKVKEDRTGYYVENKKDILNYKKEYYIENKENILKCRREHYANTSREKKIKFFKPECIHDRIYELRKEKTKKPLKERKVKTPKPPKERKIPQDRKEYCKQYKRERRKGDIGFRLIEVLRSDFQRAFKGKGKKSKKTKEYIEFTVEEFKTHIEHLFQEGMSWENWNRYGWHLDHIKPITSFKIVNGDGSENLEEIKACFALENLQPLWAKDNLSKGDKF